MSASLTERVQAVIDWMRPIVQSDGGDVELVDVSPEGTVKIRFHGACVGCPSVAMTIMNLKERLPEVREVVQVNELISLFPVE